MAIVLKASAALALHGLKLVRTNTPLLMRAGGYGSSHDGEWYELHLREECFFRTVAYIKQERRCHNLLAEDDPDLTENLGLMTNDDYSGDSDH